MIYGNKIKGFLLVALFLSFFLIGCSKEIEKNWYYELYDGYRLKSFDNKVALYKDEEEFSINELDYQVKAFKYNSDVVCLKLKNNDYYMIYYVDGNIYGPYDLDSLNTATESFSMSFDNDFIDVNKVSDKIYE